MVFNPTLVRLRRRVSQLALRQKNIFNPTLVRLRPPQEEGRLPPSTLFNPTLVRLRLIPPSRSSEGLRVFQSHAGSIEAPSVSSATASVVSFSIPRWFD